jgi:replicative DNA helicase
MKTNVHDIECAILGACLYDPLTCIELVKGEIQVDDFHGDYCRTIFSTLVDMEENKIPVDLLTIRTELEKQGKTEQHLIDFYTNLAEHCSTSAGIKYFIAEFKRIQLQDIIFNTIPIMVSQYGSEGKPVEEIADEIIHLINKSKPKPQIPIISAGEAAKDTYKRIERLAESDSHITGISTGFRDLDRNTSGWQNGDMIVLAGRPGMGKSVLGKDILEKSNVPCLLVNLEMSTEQTQLRQLSGIGKIQHDRIRAGRLKDNEWSALVDAINKLSAMPLYYIDTGHLTAGDLYMLIQYAIKKYGIRLVVVDYLQLMTGAKENREQAIADISRTIKNTAKEFHIPIIALAQLNRSCEARPNKRPLLSDLRESGSIEQDADVVIFIYRDEMYNQPTDETRNVAEINIAKGRNCRTGFIKLVWSGEYQSFKDYEYHEEDAPYWYEKEND